MPYLQTDDLSVFYEDFGVGEPILFLHSGYSRGIIAFSGQIQPFFHSYRCLMPDFRGHGRTRCESKDWNTPMIADDMANFLRLLKIDKAHLIGYSLGGGVALHLAAKYPELVHSIITIGCCGFADPTGADDYEPEALIKNNQSELIELMKVQHAEAHGGDWQYFMHQSAQDWRRYPDLSENAWSKLTMPMLFIAGEHDPFTSRQRLLDMQVRCPQAEIWAVPSCSHRPHMPTENAKEVNDRMLDFLKSIM